MNTLTLSYPPMPAGADKSILKPSASFTKKVYGSIAAILLFVLCYLLLFAITVCLAIAFGALGIGIISLKVHWLTIMVGLGLIGSGLMLIFFVIKFLFKKNHEDRSDLMEITAAEQPNLFAFINKITEEANAPAPKRIYLSADVNAGVFYDSSFWSMFLPVKKNLKIGLGLVNSVNVSEFKAVMAHEFGHFSQRSMKFGSYVYNLNKVIYNMLYDNEGYERVLGSMAASHWVFKAIAFINVQIIKGMQYVLRQVYIVLNKTYMSLSREMEFHADAVAAYVSGSNHLVTSLKRIEIGQLCYSRLLDYWNTKLAENKRSENIYPQQLEMMRLFADRRLMPTDSAGLPVIKKGMFITDNSEVVIEDQWSSHPSTEDRELHLERINLFTDVNHQSAWSLFNNAGELQVMLTNHLYAGVTKSNEAAFVNLNEFKEDFNATVNTDLLDKRYKNYYDRNINEFDVDAALAAADGKNTYTFDSLFTDENCALPQAAERMEGDAEIMDTITNVRLDIKNFDYKGNKYSRDDAPYIKGLINTEHKETEARIKELDEQAFIYFTNICGTPAEREELAGKYKMLFACQRVAVGRYQQYGEALSLFNKIYESMPYAEISNTVDAIYAKEKDLKPVVKQLVANENINCYLTAAQVEEVNKYLMKDWVYFNHPNYDNEAIDVFNKGTQAYISAVSKHHFEMKKYLLNFQLNLLENRA
ncbi:M48 family metallopeptidase [Mucilaginibacter sp. ZT4R22]|uniref:M48 family metallopeptidase n=1 Tax=Mucilaginibacter pankratovii TaxID=2772110 RepID=A0ABR7WP52_9SPHI|nr:M48 family metallopeptidase [Mucilaginibacter pankratovii]MBD1364062.1 M48 family metallopeptidase [Mucilaginibacter pankratovii]